MDCVCDDRAKNPFLLFSLAVFIHCVSFAFHISLTHTHTHAHSLTDWLTQQKLPLSRSSARPGSFMFARILPHISLSLSHTHSLSLSLARKNSSFGIALSRHPTAAYISGPETAVPSGALASGQYIAHSTRPDKPFAFSHPISRAAPSGRDNVLTPARALSLLLV